MSSGQPLREFISKRLSAAAEEIFSEFVKTIVCYEEELDRQRRLLDISWNPQITLHRAELPLHYVRKDEEVLPDQQQLWTQERTSSSNPGQPEPLQMKVEQDEPEPSQEELSISQDEEQLVLKQEAVSSRVTPADEERNHNEPEPNRNQLPGDEIPKREESRNEAMEQSQRSSPTRDGSELQRHRKTEAPQHHVRVKEEDLTDQQLCSQETSSSLDQEEPEPPLMKEEQQELFISQREEDVTFLGTSPSEDSDSCEPEPNRKRPLCESSTEAENHHQDGRRNENSDSNSDEELKLNKRRKQNKDHKNNHKLKMHETHGDERPFSCDTCGKCFCKSSHLIVHTRTHTGEKPYPCQTCGRCFSRSSDLTAHMRTHTGEKPFSCGTCGRCFSKRNILTVHMRTHTGERPCLCQTCGKSFRQRSNLITHLRTHKVKKM